jgi:hypothetical protein
MVIFYLTSRELKLSKGIEIKLRVKGTISGQDVLKEYWKTRGNAPGFPF